MSPLLMEGTGGVIHAPERGAHLPALSAASSADALLTDRPPRGVSIPTPRAAALGVKGKEPKQAAALGNLELRSRKKEKRQSWSRQADL